MSGPGENGWRAGRRAGRHGRRAADVVLALALAAGPGRGCGQGADPAAGQVVCRMPEPAEIPAPPAVAYRRCPLASKVGEFQVELAQHFTAVSGSIAEAPLPTDVREVVVESGPCRLLRRRVLDCDPACTAGMTCAEAGRCVRYPGNLDAGTVGVTGLRCQVQMHPDPVSQRYWDTNLPHPGYEPGASIGLHASGAAVPPFSLAGWGVAPLVLDQALLRLEPGQPVPIAWTPGQAGPARIQLDLVINQHGITPATLSCEVPDSGRFEVPVDLIERLLAAGTSGYPQLRVSRQTSDSADLPPGCVEFVVSSAVERSLDVAGHTPCRSDVDCPTPKRCQVVSQSCL